MRRSPIKPALLACAVLALGAAAADAAPIRNVSIGTGSVTGVYYTIGRAICRLVGKESKRHGIRCRAEETKGSIANLRALRAGQIEMAVVQSDAEQHAVTGGMQFRTAGRDRTLRSVLSLHREPFTLLVRGNSEIKRFSDLKGKRVNFGARGSGHRATMEVIFSALGWKKSDLRKTGEFGTSEQVRALCDDRMDAAVFIIGHPNHAVSEAISTCGAVILPVEGPVIAPLLANRPYYRPAVIAGGLYGRNRKDVRTFGVTARLVATADLPADTVYEIVKAVFSAINTFRKSHPALAPLRRKAMVPDDFGAPIHAGAARYFSEKGLD